MAWSALRWPVVGLGLVLVVVGLGADVFGLGGNPGFGWKQILVTVAGGIMVAVGVLSRPADRGR